jgi:peroxiredoxin
MKQLVIIGLFPLLSSCSWFQPKYVSGLEGQNLPNIDLMLKDGLTSFSTASIVTGKPFIIFLYQPYCSYCRAQTDDIVNNITAFNTHQLYLVTTDSYPQMKQFAEHYHLEKYPNVILARDSASRFLDYFKAPGVPYLAFYDEHKKLKQVILGKNDFSTIKNILAN